MPFEPPPPIAALAYSVPLRAGRPGIITAIGVLSIVVASLSALANLYTAGSLLVFSMMASFAGSGGFATPATATVQVSPAPAATSPTTGPAVYVSDRGFEEVTRGQVVGELANLRFLSAARVAQLDALLAKAGRDMFPVDGDEPPPAGRVESLVLSSTTGLSADPNVPGPDTFRTAGGRFELYDDRAVYYPTHGEIVRAAAQANAAGGLSAAQVESVIQQAQSSAGGVLNPSQVAALRTLLAAPGQQLVSPVTIPTAVRAAQPLGDGTVLITFPNGMASIGPQGQVTSNATGAGGPAPFGMPSGRIPINGAAMALAGFATVASFGLAIYLLVIGILVLRESPRGRKLHLVYAMLKIPVTILGAVAGWWVTTSFFDAFMAAAGSAATPAGMFSAGIGMILGAIGLIYPIALLIALQSRTVKDYYNSVAQ